MANKAGLQQAIGKREPTQTAYKGRDRQAALVLKLNRSMKYTDVAKFDDFSFASTQITVPRSPSTIKHVYRSSWPSKPS
jgi:hypothetical protein